VESVLQQFRHTIPNFISGADPTWLVDPELKRGGYVVQFTGALQTDYSQYEGKQATVLSVYEAGRHYTHSAHIRLTDGGRELPQVPIEYLRPVAPTKQGEKVVCLTGAYKGKQAILDNYDSSVCTIRVDVVDQYEDAPRDTLCLFED
jgi:hypothetical protein